MGWQRVKPKPEAGFGLKDPNLLRLLISLELHPLTFGNYMVLYEYLKEKILYSGQVKWVHIT